MNEHFPGNGPARPAPAFPAPPVAGSVSAAFPPTRRAVRDRSAAAAEPPPVASAGAPPPYPPSSGVATGGPSEPAAPAAPPAPSSRPSATAGAPQTVPGRGERNSRIGLAQVVEANDLDLDSALRAMIAKGGSDLHLTSGAMPMARIDGSLVPLEDFDTLRPDSLQRTLYSILTERQRETFEDRLELDFAYAVRGVSRFRVNLYKQRDSIGAAFRVIPYEIKPLDQLGVPPVVANFAGMPRGLVLVTGPTGSGKSTTLAAIVDLANRTRSDHIMTVEDPIEFLHRHKRCLVNQREVGEDTHSFADALKHVLRQDPDIILVGEMRDLETISVALTAAETGHLVFGTLHTQDAAQTVDRVIDVFPAHQQDQIRTQLASALQGVVSQTLCRRATGRGRAVATEVMIATPAIRNLIREGKTHQIYSAMQAGAAQGMHTMDQHLAELVRTGKITYEVGLEKAHHVEDYNRLVGRTSRMAQGAGGMSDPVAAVAAQSEPVLPPSAYQAPPPPAGPPHPHQVPQPGGTP